MSDSMRSLYSFGVAGLLKEDCIVYYCNNMQSKSIGRVSDLISAQLKDFKTDELRLRASLLFSFFGSKVIHKFENESDAPFKTPVNLEIGIDGTYTAIGISFNWDSYTFNFSGILDRFKNKNIENDFELLLYQLSEISTQVIVKYEHSKKRIEIDSILHRGYPNKRDPIEIVAIDTTKSMLIEAKQYIEIGDLNYNILINEKSEILVSTNSSEGQSGGETLLSANTDDVKIENISIKNGNISSNVDKGKGISEDQLKQLNAKIKQLTEENEKLKNQGLTKQFTIDSKISDDEKIVLKASQENVNENPVVNFLKNIWPFKEENTSDDLNVLEPKTDEANLEAEVNNTKVDSVSHSETVTSLKQEESKIQDTPAADEAQLNTVAIPADAEKSLNELKKIAQANELSKNEIAQEKARLADLHKELNKQMRQREMDFKNKERSLNTEIRKKEDELRQKNTFISRQKEQIAALNAALEQAKSATGRTEDAQSKLKIDTLQKLANMKDEENKKLNLKVKDLENRLIVAQSKSTKAPQQDNQANAKIQGLEKKIEEYKRLNQRLTETLNSASNRGNDRESQDLKRKIEILERQSNESKKNLEKTQFRLKEVQDSEKKLQLDLNRALEENKKLRQSLNKTGSDGSQAA